MPCSKYPSKKQRAMCYATDGFKRNIRGKKKAKKRRKK